MSYDLVKATNTHLTRKRFRKPSDCHFYPSEASVVVTNESGEPEVLGGCLRASYYRCMGIKAKPHNARSESIFELGRAVEDMLVNLWKEMGIYVARSVRFQNSEYNISGELDVVVRDPKTNELILVECKSFYGYYATVEIFGNKSTKPRPKINNLLQTLVYTYEFKDMISYSKLLYEDRGNGDKKSFDIRLILDETEEDGIVHRPEIDGKVTMDYTIEDIYARYDELQDYITKGVVPERDFELTYSNEKIEDLFSKKKLSKSKYEKFKKVSKKDGSVRYVEKERPGDFQCGYCNYKEICWK